MTATPSVRSPSVSADEVVAGLAARRADAEEAAAAGRHRVAEVGTEREVFADVAVGTPPVAGGEDAAGGVDDVDGERAGALVELFEVAVDLRRQLGPPFLCSRRDVALQPKCAGKVSVLADLTLEAGRVEVEPMPAGGLQFGEAQLLGETVCAEAAQRHQGEEQQQDRQVAQGAAGHGVGGVWGAYVRGFRPVA
jgi:hypothetical protein